MSAAPRFVLLTPNLLGTDGVSCLSRQIVHALPDPVETLSLHDAPESSRRLHSAGGSRIRFVVNAIRLGLHGDRDTVIVCSHVHLAPMARLMTWRGARAIYVLCGIEAWVPLRAAERWALASGRLVAISAHTARRFTTANPTFRDTAIDICHPGLPPRAVESSPRSGELAALIVGRMSASETYKGHEELLHVWPRLLERHPGAQLWVVGDGDDRPRLEALASHLGIAAAVTFTGRVTDEELDRRYRSCRFFVMPSRHEGFGLVFLEAMRAGKACIGSPGAAEEIIQHGVTGLIVDASRADELSAAIARLFDAPDLCDAFGRAGAARFRTDFTDARFAARFAPSVTSAVSCEPALTRRVS
jgi:glycosyltransferase involved in cell wall biosynthesis